MLTEKLIFYNHYSPGTSDTNSEKLVYSFLSRARRWGQGLAWLSQYPCSNLYFLFSPTSDREGTEVYTLHRYLMSVFDLTSWWRLWELWTESKGAPVLGLHPTLISCMTKGKGKSRLCEAKNPNGVSFPIHAGTSSPQIFSDSYYFSNLFWTSSYHFNPSVSNS